MDSTFTEPPKIVPLAPGHKRPLWSVMIPVFNCAHYLTHTLQCVLEEQIPEHEMQIEVVDDASTDADIQAMVERIGKGRISYFRQAQNVGSLRNFETCLNRSRGQLVHLLHGDDRINPGFYEKMGGLFRQYPEAGAALCRFQYINQAGKKQYLQNLEREREGMLDNWLPRIAVRNLSQYAATVVRRGVYERLGGFYGVTYGEDWEMWVRIAKHYPVVYTPEVLAEYRKHETSISSNKFLTGQNAEDMLRVMAQIQGHLPEEHRKEVLRKSKKFYAHYGIRVANQVWHAAHHRQGVQAQIKYALQMHMDIPLLWKTGKVYIKMKLNIQ